MQSEELKVSINNSCHKCGLCAKMCPVYAISIKKGSFRIGASCIACFACLEICPAGAIEYYSSEGSGQIHAAD